MKTPVIVESKHGRAGDRGVTYQLELVLCGKPGCEALHGPYWYAYWRAGRRTIKRYVGRTFRALTAADVRAAEPAIHVHRSEFSVMFLGNNRRAKRRLPKVEKRGKRRDA